MDTLPRIALVGRPNVGKSTLFNRLVGQHIAITAPEAGTTRDRLEQRVTLQRVPALLIDIGGIDTRRGTPLEEDIQAQAHYAIEAADVILFLIDAKSELTADDIATADLLRRGGKPLLFVANKFESERAEDLLQFASLGLGVPLGISAVHKTGLSELEIDLAKLLRKVRRAKKLSNVDLPVFDANIALVGRPNVGKSSLVNALLGEKRVIVSDVPCTTRDVNDLVLEQGGKTFRLLDTAGLRRSGKIGTGLDRFATGRTLAALEEADVALLLLDGSEALAAQDLHVAEKILEAGCGLILVVNKVDTWSDFEEEQEKWLRRLTNRFVFANFLPVVMISAETGQNLEHLLPRVLEVAAERRKRIVTGALNRLTRRIIAEHPPTRTRTRGAPKIFYVTQAEAAPPTFVFFVSHAKAFHFSYRRYLENRFREEFGFLGVPLRIEFRERKRKTLEK